MKKVSFFFTVLLSVCSSFTMQLSIKTDVHAVVFLRNKLAIGAACGFGFVTPNLSSLIWRNTLPAYDIIPNPNKQKVAFLCKDCCYIYDAATEKQVDKLHVPDQDDNNHINYTATFSSGDDTFFICQKQKLQLARALSIILPSIDNKNFPIACHPTQKQILYPSSPQTLSLKQFDGGSTLRYSLNKQIKEDETILSATYHPNGHDIVVLTDKKNVYLYNPAIKKGSASQIIFMHPCHDITFIPYTTFIGAISPKVICYYDYTQRYTAVIKILTLDHDYSDQFTHTFDFSPTGTHYALILKKKLFIHHTPLEIVKNFYCCIYWHLKNYCIENNIPLDIFQLLIKKVLMFT